MPERRASSIAVSTSIPPWTARHTARIIAARSPLPLKSRIGSPSPRCSSHSVRSTTSSSGIGSLSPGTTWTYSIPSLAQVAATSKPMRSTGSETSIVRAIPRRPARSRSAGEGWLPIQTLSRRETLRIVPSVGAGRRSGPYSCARCWALVLTHPAARAASARRIAGILEPVDMSGLSPGVSDARPRGGGGFLQDSARSWEAFPGRRAWIPNRIHPATRARPPSGVIAPSQPGPPIPMP
jgi:hypothetical protein